MTEEGFFSARCIADRTKSSIIMLSCSSALFIERGTRRSSTSKNRGTVKNQVHQKSRSQDKQYCGASALLGMD
jgi:hypothetical protein